MQVEFNTYNEFLVDGLALVLEYGKDHNSRAGITKEIENVQITIRNNSRREMLLLGRGNNPIATTVETLWVLSGSNNAKWLSTYLPRAMEYCDPGSDLWANGYGPRLRNWHGKDQIKSAFNELNNFPESRRCVLGINDPLYCLNEETKDVACNLHLNIYLREKLHLTASSRSMDILWGSAVNFSEWSVLQSMMASWLGKQPGDYTHFVTSLHLYDSFFEKAKKIVDLNRSKNTDGLHNRLYSEFPVLKMSDSIEKSFSVFNDVSLLIDDPSYSDMLLKTERYDSSTWENYAVCCLIIGEFIHHFKTTGKLSHDLFSEYEHFNMFDKTVEIINSRLVESVERVILVEYLLRVGFLSNSSEVDITYDEKKFIDSYRRLYV